jgi:hypothetical protein
MHFLKNIGTKVGQVKRLKVSSARGQRFFFAIEPKLRTDTQSLWDLIASKQSERTRHDIVISQVVGCFDL